MRGKNILAIGVSFVAAAVVLARGGRRGEGEEGFDGGD